MLTKVVQYAIHIFTVIIYELKLTMKDGDVAYRSIQTLLSWVIISNSLNSEVPSINQQQRTLITIGDKKGNFFNSKTCIGAIEFLHILENITHV